jgi:DNA-binding transcriptional MerR regulator
MLMIGQLAAYAGVTVRAVRHYHQVGLLPEPERDASGYRQYGAAAVVSLVKIRTLASAGVPLSQIGELLEADETAFAEAIQRIDSHLREEILYQVLSALSTSDAGDDDPRLAEAADIMADLAEQAYTAGDTSFSEAANDDLPFDLLDALGNEYDHRVARLQELMRERGWARWTRLERLAEPPG